MSDWISKEHKSPKQQATAKGCEPAHVQKPWLHVTLATRCVLSKHMTLGYAMLGNEPSRHGHITAFSTGLKQHNADCLATTKRMFWLQKCRSQQVAMNQILPPAVHGLWLFALPWLAGSQPTLPAAEQPLQPSAAALLLVP